MTTAAAALAAYTSDADLRAAKLRLGEALPEEGWLADYLRAVVPLTDAPVEFHLAAGLCAISAALGNGIRVESWGQNVFPHLWVVLVAPSSFWRKSTSINTAEAMLHSAVPDAALPSEFSREAFLEGLAEHPAGLFAVKEFGGFLSLLGRDYMAGSKENLTELYDGPELFKRALKKKVIEIRRPAITILGATTLDWLESKITDGDLRGGFLARFLFVTAREKASAKGLTSAMPMPTRNRLVEQLKAIADATLEVPDGRMVYGPGAEDAIDEWMHGWEAEVTGTRHRTDLSGFAVRLQTYALKLAMIYRASATVDGEAGSSAVIDEASVRAAIAYCRVLWANVAALIDEEIATTRESRELRRLTGIIGSGTDRSTALRLSKLKSREFDEFLTTLIRSHVIVQERRRAHDVGLDRSRNTEVMWLAPATSSNGHSRVLEFPVGVPSSGDLEFTGIASEPEGTLSEAELQELQGPDSLSESPSSSLSSSSPYPLSSVDSSDVDTRARGRNRKRPPSVDPLL